MSGRNGWGVRCPACDEPLRDVRETRRHKRHIYRQRWCATCQDWRPTRELTLADVHRLEQAAEKLRVLLGIVREDP